MNLPIFELFPNIKAEDFYMFVTALLAMVVMYMLVSNLMYTSKIASRVKSLQGRRAQLRNELMGPRRRNKKNTSSMSVNMMRMVVDRLNLLQKSQVGKMNKVLANAGYRSKDAIFIYTFFQLIGPIVGLFVGVYDLNIDFSNPFASPLKLVTLVIGVFVGLKLPQIIVKNARDKRYYNMQKGLSDTLDLMMICAEAGLSLAASLERVSRELGMTYPELAEELALTSIELGFLPDRKKALSNLVERVDMPEIRGISGVLIQTEKYGTPVAQALRVLAAEFRTQRMLRAEQKAARLPAIMTVPMIVFILPTLFVVVLAPALLKL